jgi:hypothetical protein
MLIDLGRALLLGGDRRRRKKKDGRDYLARYSRRAFDGAAEFSTHASVHQTLLLLLLLLHPRDRSR